MSDRQETDFAVNWLGQKIQPGTPVFRGARDGNTSSFKVGVVKKVFFTQEAYGQYFTARVEWMFEPSTRWEKGRRISYVNRIATSGSPSLDSLVVIDVDTFNRLDKVAVIR